MASAVRDRVSPGRRCAYAVVRRTFEQGARTDLAMHAEVARAELDARERAFATRLAYGTVQRRATLDHVLGGLIDRPLADLDPPVLTALRLGVFQLVFSDGVPDHAAVDQSVELAKSAGGGHALVNAVLRRATREAAGRLAALGDANPAEAALRHSHPEWIARLLWDALGPEAARAQLARDNEPAEAAVRANELVTGADTLADSLMSLHEVPARRAEGLPEALVLDGPFDAHGSPLFEEGALMPQSRGSMLVSRVLAPRPGERVLDLCAAPGGKTTHAAALMRGRGRVVAVERHPGRAAALERTCRRMRADNVEVRVADAREPAGETFDRVLVDAPCSGLGTLQARPDLRWRIEPEDVERLASLQSEILAAAAGSVRPGGVLVYATCTISPRENEDQVAALLARHPELSADDLRSDFPLWKHPTVADHLQTLPHRDGTDGFFVARLRRAER